MHTAGRDKGTQESYNPALWRLTTDKGMEAESLEMQPYGIPSKQPGQGVSQTPLL